MTYKNDAADNVRVEFLRSLHILDTGPDANINRIVTLTRTIFDAPIADISLIDDDRQWFKSMQGLDVEETRREDSFCNITIANDGIFEVPDATKHEFLKNNPYVVGEPNVRYYMGAPLAISGFRIGALCIMDTNPRNHADPIFREHLLNLAAIASREIYLQHILREAIPAVLVAAATTSTTSGTGTVISEGTGMTTSSGVGTTATTETGTTTKTGTGTTTTTTTGTGTTTSTGSGMTTTVGSGITVTTGTGRTSRTGVGSTESITPGLKVTTTSGDDSSKNDKKKSPKKK